MSKRKKKDEFKWYNWAMFGALIGAITISIILAISFVVLGLSNPETMIPALLPSFVSILVTSTLTLIFVGILVIFWLALLWVIKGLLYHYVAKDFLKKYPIYWQLAVLSVAVDVTFSFLLTGQINLFTAIMSAVAIWLALTAAKYLDFKIPVKKEGKK